MPNLAVASCARLTTVNCWRKLLLRLQCVCVCALASARRKRRTNNQRRLRGRAEVELVNEQLLQLMKLSLWQALSSLRTGQQAVVFLPLLAAAAAFLSNPRERRS